MTFDVLEINIITEKIEKLYLDIENMHRLMTYFPRFVIFAVFYLFIKKLKNRKIRNIRLSVI